MTQHKPDASTPAKRGRRGCGCGFWAFALLVLAAIAVAVVFLLYLRPNPNPPLAPWIPPEADAAAQIELDLSPEALGGLTRIALEADPSLTPAQRNQALAGIKQLVQMALYPKILLVGRVDPQTLEVTWAVVGNTRRGQNLLQPLSQQLLGDEVKWTEETVEGRKTQRVRADSLGLEGIVHGTQIIVSSNPQWLTTVSTQSAASTPPPVLDLAAKSKAPMRVAIHDSKGSLRQVLTDLAGMRSDPDIAMAADNLNKLLQDAQGEAVIDLWLLVKEARAIISPAPGRLFHPATLQTVAAEVQEDLALLIGMPKVQLVRVVEHEGRPSLEIMVPAFGFVLSQSFQ